MTSSFSPNSTLSPSSSPSELHCPLLQTMSSNTLNKDTGVIMAQYKTEIVELVEVYLAACRDNVRLPELCIEPDYLKFGDSLRGAGEGSWTQSMGHRRMRKKDSLFPSSPSSPTPTSVTRSQHGVQGPIDLFGFKNCPTNEVERDD